MFCLPFYIFEERGIKIKMKIAGINNNSIGKIYGVKNINNISKTTPIINKFSKDKISFGMIGSGKVNDMNDLIHYVGRENALNILKVLQNCRYSKANILTSKKTKIKRQDNRVFLTNFDTPDENGKFKGNCNELVIKAGKEIKKKCPDLNIRGMSFVNREYEMFHCVLAITRKNSSEDFAVKNEKLDFYNDILVIDPSFRSYKMEHFLPLISKIYDIEEEEMKCKNKKGVVELEVNRPIVIGNYADIATDLHLPYLSQEFGTEVKQPLIAVYYNGAKVKATMVAPEQNKKQQILSYATKILEPHINKFMQSL